MPDSNQGLNMASQVILNIKAEASSFAAYNKDDILNEIQGQTFNDIKKKAKEAGVDAIVLACARYVTRDGINDLVEKYKKLAATIDTQNGAIVWSAYSTSEAVFLGESGAMLDMAQSGDKTNNTSGKDGAGNMVSLVPVRPGKVPRMDYPMTTVRQETGSGTTSSAIVGSDKTGYPGVKDGVSLVWEQRSDWLWVDFASRYITRAGLLGFPQESCTLYPKMLYLYRIVASKLVNSRFDEDAYAFPFTDQQMEATDIWYTSPFGWRTSTNSMHRGIDIACDRGVEIHAVHDGVVTAAGNGFAEACNSVNIDHGDGTYSRYMHCNTISVSNGQKVSKGDVIATVGGTGASGPDTYPNHLHLEICQGGSEETYSNMDPLTYFPKFNIPKDGQILPA